MEENTDLSKLFEIANMIKNANSSTQSEQTTFNEQTNQPFNPTYQCTGQTNSNFEMPDMETLMKISQIMKAMNSTENNASTNLLYSLKPFLRKSKQNKIEQYVKLLKLSSVISEFNKGNNNGTKLF